MATTMNFPSDLEFKSRRSVVMGMRGVCASSQPLASAAGLQILQKGGNAADAAVAMAAALNVLEPCSTGIGGDAFALWYDAKKRTVESVQGNGRSPAGLNLDLVKQRGHQKCLPLFDALTVTVPGTAAAWVDIVERHGSLPLSVVLGPAIELAEGGFPVGPITAHHWQEEAQKLRQGSPEGVPSPFLIDGLRAPRAGEVFRNPLLAETFRQVASHGKDGFYLGRIAQAIVEAVQSRGGVLSLEDLAEHKSSFKPPISTIYRGTIRVWETPPPSQGLAALLALNLMELQGPWEPQTRGYSAARLHSAIECMRLAFSDALNYVTDPSVQSCPTEGLLSKEYAKKRAGDLNRDQACRALPGIPPPSPSDTVYFCTVDAQGNGCSMIQSNYMGFGTGIAPVGCGFSLQNRGHNFSLDPQHPNCLAPRKRPFHTIIPGLATWIPSPPSPSVSAGAQQEEEAATASTQVGLLHSVFGVMGGFMQPQGHLQVISNMVDFGMDPQAALDEPRFCVAGLPDLEHGHGAHSVHQSWVFLEDRDNGEEVVKELEKRGHRVELLKGHNRSMFGRGQIIVQDPHSKALFGGSDARADGCAIAW